ncbi:MAG: DNA polymerase III subunit alpha, partial [Acidimicrobiales bacterium]|nr:DNA polymerase III subunit alpha [Acidimicrobiales bacterium]
QEQMMRFSQKFAGYTLAEADNLRKAAGKKKRELMAREREKFIEGCVANDYGEQFGKDKFDVIEGFADYAFNKSHSYGYGLVAYQTAYLKANYPTEYLACLLTSVKNKLETAAVFLNDCRQLGINVLVPDINTSDLDFGSIPDQDGRTLHGRTLNAITFGLSGVRNVGEGIVEKIIEERTDNGPFESFGAFCDRVELSVLNKRAIESLIKAGAFDSLGHPRKGLLMIHEEFINKTVQRRKEEDMGVQTLFGAMEDTDEAYDDRPSIAEEYFDKTARLKLEKEMLGLYVSDHPLMGVEAALQARASATVGDLAEFDDGAQVAVGGVVSSLVKKWTKKGELMAVFVLEDLSSSIETMVFPRTFTDYGHLLEDDRIVVVRGRVSRRDEDPKLMVSQVEVVDADALAREKPITITVRPDQLSDAAVADLKACLSEHPGRTPIVIDMGTPQLIRLSDAYRVDSGNGLFADLRVMFGADCIG